MNIQNLIGESNVTISVTPADLKEFALLIADEVKKANAIDNRLYTPEMFAKLHGVDVSTLWRWRKAGTLKATQIGGRVFYKENDLKKEIV